MTTNDLIAPLANEKSDIETLNNEEDIEINTSTRKPKEKVQWYYAPAFLLFWLALFFAVIIPVYFHLPDGLTIENEAAHPNEFIAERAQRVLYEFDRIGPKVVGSHENENMTVQLILNEIESTRRYMQNDLFDLELDVQVASGSYMHWELVNMYQSIQNIIVKLSSKNSTSQSYLLMNSHFDSQAQSPGTGDDGAMVVVMLEVLRVIATNRQTFLHPIVFLFNGAEENPLQGAHAFITQHRWANNCKALINLDSAGSGHKEILFQSGPNNPWLMDYYYKHIKYPYATSIAEELFQAGALPSDTDFRIFRDHGPGVPGLDLAHSYNGYVYHTKFDNFNVIPRGTLQVTGTNMLALARGLANAPELEDASENETGHTVFYDFLGLFFIYYTETAGMIVNICLAVIGIIVVCISLWRIAVTSQMSILHALRLFGILCLLHLLGFLLAIGLPLLMAVLFDAGDRSLTWFTNKWLVIGLFITPSLFGLCLPTLLYLSYVRYDKLTQPFKVHMVLHAHCVILAVLCIVLTSLEYRSTYLIMMSLLFYIGALIINLISTLHGKSYFWVIVLLVSQIMPFLYFTYITHALLVTLMPMMGRYGTTTNPDLFVAILCALGSVLSMGFLIPLLNLFRKPKIILISLAIITFIFSMIALTHVGFPYRPKTNVCRMNLLHVRRVFYEYDKSISLDETGFWFDFQDRRVHHPIEEHIDLTGMQLMNENCDLYMMCGVPVFAHRMSRPRREGRWLPAKEPLELPGTPTLTLLNRITDDTTQTAHYEFELSGPTHMDIFMLPLEGVTITDWSFLKEYLEDPAKWESPPYHIYFSYGKYNTPLKFFFDFKKNDTNFNEPLFELGIGGHYIHYDYERSTEAQHFYKSFPDYVFAREWPSSYERYLF